MKTYLMTQWTEDGGKTKYNQGYSKYHNYHTPGSPLNMHRDQSGGWASGSGAAGKPYTHRILHNHTTANNWGLMLPMAILQVLSS